MLLQHVWPCALDLVHPRTCESLDRGSVCTDSVSGGRTPGAGPFLLSARLCECVHRSKGQGASTNQHVFLRVQYQLPAHGGHLLFTFLLLVRARSVAPANCSLRNQEGPGDQQLEVLWDFCGVDQLQLLGGQLLT